jgi:methyl-accepting chemotaxis protein
MENGKLQAATSVEQTDSSGEALENINTKIAIVHDMNNLIASASEKQTAVAEEINRNVHNISVISEQTSDGAQKTSASCNDLLALSEQLKQTIGHFKT